MLASNHVAPHVCINKANVALLWGTAEPKLWGFCHKNTFKCRGGYERCIFGWTKNTGKISALEDSSVKETITGKSVFFWAATSKCECSGLIVQQNKALLSGLKWAIHIICASAYGIIEQWQVAGYRADVRLFLKAKISVLMFWSGVPFFSVI